MNQLTREDLVRLLRDSAGVDETVDLEGDILDRSLEELGYDSLSALEIAASIQRQFDVILPDEGDTKDRTVRWLLDFVNADLGAQS